MTKENISLIIDFLESVYDDDRKLNTAIYHFIDVVAPWSYAPIVDWKISSIFATLKIPYPEITELLEYYFYESKNMDEWWMIESNGKKYNYSNKEEVIQSMLDFWYITK